MFCKYCGSKLLDDAAFCHECGKATCEQPLQPVYQQPVVPVQPVQQVYQQPAPPVPPVQPVYHQPVPQQPVYQQPVYQSPIAPQYTYTIPAQPVQQPVQQSVADTQQEKLEKQTLTLGILGICLSILGLPGFILSVIAAKKASTYKKLTGKVDGKVLVGYHLSKAGRAIGIVMTVVLYVLLLALESGAFNFAFDIDPVLPDHFSGGNEF